MATVTKNIGTTVELAHTALDGIASSATAGWKSAKVDDYTSVKALDYQIMIKLAALAGAPANDKAVYIYICPWYYDSVASAWSATDAGTTTLPTDGDATYTIASPNDLRLLGVLSYTTAAQPMMGVFNLSSAFGAVMPDGFSIIIVNYSGQALAGSGNIVAYKPIKQDIA